MANITYTMKSRMLPMYRKRLTAASEAKAASWVPFELSAETRQGYWFSLFDKNSLCAQNAERRALNCRKCYATCRWGVGRSLKSCKRMSHTHAPRLTDKSRTAHIEGKRLRIGHAAMRSRDCNGRVACESSMVTPRRHTA